MRNRLYGVCAVLGLLALVSSTPGPAVPPAGAQEAVAKQDWKAADFEQAGSLICAWEKGKKNEVAKTCEDLGFKLVDTTAMSLGVVCEWTGKLDPTKVEALRKANHVRYVEPNLRRYATPIPGRDLDQSVKFEPVFTKDNVLDELKKSKQMICAVRPGTTKDEVAKACEDLGLTIVDAHDGAPAYVVCSWKDALKQETVDKVADLPGVLYVEPNVERRIEDGPPPKPKKAQPVPGQPFAILPQDQFVKDLYGMRHINAPIAWRNVQASNVIVAVCDTGIDYTHEDLRDNMWRNPKRGAPDKFGADFIDTKFDRATLTSTQGSDPKDRHFHGTHVAGTIGAVGNNGIGVAGVNWRVQLMAVRCLGADGAARSNSVQKAIEYAVDNGAKIINLSLGGGGALQSELEVIKKAQDKGVILVCAAGNEGKDNGTTPNFPSNYAKFVNNIVAVANTDDKDKLNPSSNFNRELVHLAAPGTDILSTMPMARTEGFDIEEKRSGQKFKTKYGRLTGTSMATPHVAGSLALMLGHPKYANLASKPAAEATAVLLKSVHKLPELDGKCSTGGLLDLTFLGEEAGPPPVPKQPTPSPPPAQVCPRHPPVIIYYPPQYQLPQYPNRRYGRPR